MRAVPGTSTLLSIVVVVILTASFSSCAAAHRSASASSSPVPSLSSVARQRFVTTVDIDQGGLVVDPPGGVSPGVAGSKAEAMFRGADAVRGDHGFAIFGLGVATVSSSVSVASDTTATTPTATTTAPTATTTTSASGTTPTTSAQNSQAPAQSVPGYDHRLAWVGIVWGDAPSCASTSGTRPGQGRTSKYVAVLFDAQTGRDALAYRSAASSCGGPPVSAHVARPTELVSVPWHPVGAASTAVEATLPACGQYAGWTRISGQGGGAGAVEVVALVPFDARCGTTSTRADIVDNVVALGNAQEQLAHAAVGPVDALRTLTGG